MIATLEDVERPGGGYWLETLSLEDVESTGGVNGWRDPV